MKNEELKGNTTWLKSQDEKLHDLGQNIELWETIKRKWMEALCFHKQQHEALGSQMKALTKEKKEKEKCSKIFEIGEFEECISITI